MLQKELFESPGGTGTSEIKFSNRCEFTLFGGKLSASRFPIGYPMRMCILISFLLHAGILVLLYFFSEPRFRNIPRHQMLIVDLSQNPSAGLGSRPLAGAIPAERSPGSRKTRQRRGNPPVRRDTLRTLPSSLPEPASAGGKSPLTEVTPVRKAEVDDSGRSGRLGEGTGALAAPPGSGSAAQQTAAGSGGGPSSGGEVAFGSPSGPSFLHRAVPQYPLLARRYGREGRVTVRLSIDEAGRLTGIEVVDDPGFGFAAAVVDALKKSRFSPSVRGGRPVSTRAILTVRFVLEEGS